MNRMLKRIFGPKSEEVRRNWRNFIMRSFIICSLHQILLGWSVKSRRTKGVEHVSCLEEMKCTCNFLVEKPEGKRLFG
jgi:hypothetical protein